MNDGVRGSFTNKEVWALAGCLSVHHQKIVWSRTN